MSPYGQGYHAALVKLGLGPSAGAATGGLGAAGLKSALPGVTKGIAARKPTVPKPPKPGAMQYNLAPTKMMGETAWQGAQKDLDTGEARSIGKVDKGQQPTPLATGSV